MSSTQRQRHAYGDSEEYKHQRLAQHLPKNISRLRAQGQANSEVSRPASHRVGHQAVQANGGEKKSQQAERDRKSTRLNSSHDQISYAVFCLKKKKKDVVSATSHKDIKKCTTKKRR